MAGTLKVRLLTESGAVLEDDAVSVVAPGGLGYLGVLHNHAPLVTTLQPGNFTWRRPDGATQGRRIGHGILEVARNQLTLLTDTMTELPEDAAAHG